MFAKKKLFDEKVVFQILNIFCNLLQIDFLTDKIVLNNNLVPSFIKFLQRDKGNNNGRASESLLSLA